MANATFLTLNMKSINGAALLALIGISVINQTPSPAAPLPVPFERLAKDCAPGVHADTLKALVNVESAGNPFAIGVVNGTLNRQPQSMGEAVATVRRLEKEGFNFSMGLSQVNRYNLAKYGESYASIFEPCRNIRTGAAILTDCYKRATTKDMVEQVALRAALSCYYSGNFIRGFKPDAPGQPSYVQKVVDAALKNTAVPSVPKIQPLGPAAEDIEIRKGPVSGLPPSNGPSAATPWVIFGQPRPPSTAETHQSTGGTVQVKPVGAKTNPNPAFVQILE